MTMKIDVMAELCERIKQRGADFDRDGDLPTPNIYLCSVFPFSGPTINAYVAADYTGVVMHKICNFVADRHGFRPMRSNSTIKVRRFRLGDLIENPAAYSAALQLAKLNNESDNVVALRRLPTWLSALTGVPLPTLDDEAASGLWAALSASLSGLRPAHRV